MASLAESAVVDLFCGVGGLTHGFVLEGFDVVAGIDSDESCRYAFETNNDATFHALDVAELEVTQLEAMYPEDVTRVLVGCAPCQPFSSYNKSGPGTQWVLVDRFADLAASMKPTVLSMENVPALRKHSVFSTAIARLAEAGYHLWHDVVDCSKYGVPQSRRRLVLLGSLLGDIELVGPEDDAVKVTVRDKIEDLASIDAGHADPVDPVHRSSGLSRDNLERIEATPAGGDWRDWPMELRLPCHKKDSGGSYPSVYGRIAWDNVAPTLTTKFHTLGTGRWGHPAQNRALSLREGALLQTFPRDYVFAEGDRFAMRSLARHIGNAVPVELGRAIARSIRYHLEEHGD